MLKPHAWARGSGELSWARGSGELSEVLLNQLNRVARYTLPQTPFNMKQSDSEKYKVSSLKFLLIFVSSVLSNDT